MISNVRVRAHGRKDPIFAMIRSCSDGQRPPPPRRQRYNPPARCDAQLVRTAAPPATVHQRSDRSLAVMTTVTQQKARLLLARLTQHAHRLLALAGGSAARSHELDPVDPQRKPNCSSRECLRSGPSGPTHPLAYIPLLQHNSKKIEGFNNYSRGPSPEGNNKSPAANGRSFRTENF
jgi:hypothetical protein